MAQNVRINSINSFQVAIESSMQDGAVEVKKEPLERPEALEDPKAVAEILVEIRRPKSINVKHRSKFMNSCMNTHIPWLVHETSFINTVIICIIKC